MPEEYVVCCAAIRTPDGVIISMPRPYRHHHLLNNTNVHKLYEGKEEQGFLVYYKPLKQICFFNRKEAATIVEDVELIDKERLFSEDLW